MPEVFVGIGSNAEPATAVGFAVAELERRFGGVRRAPVYRSAAFGAKAPDYLNTVVAFRTADAPDAVAAVLAAIEVAAGRRRTDPAVCRLDLDLLLYGRRVDAERRLPRCGILLRPFVLRPLADLAPDATHPLTGERFGAVWETRSSSEAAPMSVEPPTRR